MSDPSFISLDMLLEEADSGRDSRFIFVDLPPRSVVYQGARREVVFRFRLQRISSVGPLLAGVPALFEALPGKAERAYEEGQPSGSAKKTSPAEAMQMAKRFEMSLLGAAAGSVVAIWDGSHPEAGEADPELSGGPWKPMRMHAGKHAPKMGLFALDYLNLAEKKALTEAVIEHSTGMEVGALRALFLRLASTVLRDLAVGTAVFLRSLDRARVESGEADDQPGGDPVGDELLAPEPPEGEGREVDPGGDDSGHDGARPADGSSPD